MAIQSRSTFSDGVAEDIITELSRSRWLFVTARNSSFTYRGRSVDVKQVGRELGVRYVVEGSVRRIAGQARITVQLIDALTNTHIWAERYDREVEHVFAVQREIAEAVAGAIFPVVGDQERRRAMQKPPTSLSAWETYQRGVWHFYKLTAAENVRARQLYTEAAVLDPGFSSPHVGISETYLWDGLLYGTRSIAEAAKLAEDEARKAIAIDLNDFGGSNSLGIVLRASWKLTGRARPRRTCACAQPKFRYGVSGKGIGLGIFRSVLGWQSGCTSLATPQPTRSDQRFY